MFFKKAKKNYLLLRVCALFIVASKVQIECATDTVSSVLESGDV